MNMQNTNRYQYLNGGGEHVHLLDNQPLIGTSRVSSVIAKPLAWYGSGKAVEVFGCPNPKVLTKIKNKKASQDEITAHHEAMRNAHAKISDMTLGEFSILIDTAYRAHDSYMRSRAKSGTDLHAECEKFVKYHMQQVATDRVSPWVWPEEIRPFVDWAHAEVKRFLWAEGHVFSEKMWTGGISDCGYEKKDGTVGVLDFKSSKEAYLEQFAQCAGYDIQATENNVVDANGNLVYKLEKPITEYCIFPFGAEKPEPKFHVDIDGLKKMFRAELYIYNMLPKD